MGRLDYISAVGAVPSLLLLSNVLPQHMATKQGESDLSALDGKTYIKIPGGKGTIRTA
jgi:hypothetical protein